MANTELKRNTSTESACEMWNAVDSAAEKAPQWIKDKMNAANTDEKLKEIVEAAEKATPELRNWAIGDGETDAMLLLEGEGNINYACTAIKQAPFAAQKAIESRDALRRIRDVCEPEQPFTRAVSKPVLKAMVELIDKVLED